MNAQQLKNAILQEAIEGRLVPQDPNDEPASVLLARIRKEKERLVKEGKLKKKDLEVKPISEDEIPFEIPDSWEWVRLGAITTVLGGKRIPAGRKLSQNNTGHVYIRVSDMKDDIVSMENLQYVPKDIFPSISRYIINKEDVFITVAGTIGRIGKIPPELDGANLTENADRLVFTIIDQDWLIKCLQSVIVQSQISAVTTQVGQPKLAILRIQNLLIPLPPVEEQHRIVAKIKKLLPKVEEYGKAQDALNKLNAELPENLKKSILQEAIEGRLVPQNPNDEPASVLLNKIRQQKEQLVKKKIIKADKNESIIYRSEDGHWLEHFAYKERKDVCIDEEIPFEIPESWEWVRLGSLLQVVSDGTHKTPKYVPSGIPFLSVQNISSGHLTMDRIKFITKEEHHELIKRVKPTNGDILICRIGTLGKAIKINWDFEFSIFVSLGLLRPVEHRITDHIIFCINSPLGYKWIQDNKVGGGTHTYKINLGDMPNMLLPIPPLNEQHRIVEKLEQLLDGIDKLKK